MSDILEDTIVILAGKITAEVKSDDALRFTQAALNLAHVKAVLGTCRPVKRNDPKSG